MNKIFIFFTIMINKYCLTSLVMLMKIDISFLSISFKLITTLFAVPSVISFLYRKALLVPLVKLLYLRFA